MDCHSALARLDPAPVKALSFMLVDDNPAFLRIATRYLATSHPGELVLVGTAGTAEEALGLATRLCPEAVVTDLSLPGLSGLGLIGQLRKQRADILPIALTVHDDEAHRQAAIASGADGFVGNADLGKDIVLAVVRAARSRHREPAPKAPGAL